MNISSKKLQQLIYELSTNNSQEALKSIYIAFYPKLYRHALYYIKSESIAEEIVSDTFLVIWQQRAQMLEVYNFNAYIYRITRNIAINYLRKEINSPKIEELTTAHSYSNFMENPESELISSELMELLNQAIEELPERCQMVFKLIREENLKYKEVSEMLNISIKTTEAHISLAVRRLRETLKENMKK